MKVVDTIFNPDELNPEDVLVCITNSYNEKHIITSVDADSVDTVFNGHKYNFLKSELLAANWYIERKPLGKLHAFSNLKWG